MLNLSLAITYSIKGDFDNARFHYLESLRIGRKVYREDDEDYSRILMIYNCFILMGFCLTLKLLCILWKKRMNKYLQKYV